MNAATPISLQQTTTGIERILVKQKQAFLAEPMPSARKRQRDLDKLNNALIDYKDALIQAVNADFGNRSTAETLLAEFYATLEGIRYNRKNLTRWMQPQKRHTPLTAMPASVKVIYQPLGVVGIVVPWNFPIFLGLSPLIGALTAGNRSMIKTSEFAPRTSAAIKTMLASIFPENQVAVVEGDIEVSVNFTQLPFDHLVFTGATEVGKSVMTSAARNLTPVTLELGGKSPALIHSDFPIAHAASRLAFGKCFNAGQICVSPDYVLCPRNQVDAFSHAFTKAVSERYPYLRDNEDYTAIINDRQLSRLKNLLKDAHEKGAQILEINPNNEALSATRKMAMTLVLNTNDDMLVLQEEIFGPILPIVPYDNLEEAINYINEKPRPLALYYFDWNRSRAKSILEKTHSGGVCINDTLSHVTADDIPFGGIGQSGIGHYHGREGFLNFSKAKGVVRKGRIDTSAFVAPPWNNFKFRVLKKFLELRFRKKNIDK